MAGAERNPWDAGERARPLADEVRSRFDGAGCRGQVAARLVGSERGVSIGGSEVVVAASVFKVAVALAVLDAGATGRLDLARLVALAPGARTPGPTGFSTFRHGVTASVVDLVTMMLAVSDNAATDALIHLVGLDTVNGLLANLGCRDTVVVSDLRDLVDGVGRDMGFRDWGEFVAAQEGALGDAARARATDLDAIRAVRALDPARGTRTTADDMAGLLAAVWEDRAGAADACRMLRVFMAGQVNRDRLARGFDRPTTVAAKSGSLLGVVRNEIGVVTRPDGAQVAIAVTTTAAVPYAAEAAVNQAIADVARLVVDECARPG